MHPLICPEIAPVPIRNLCGSSAGFLHKRSRPNLAEDGINGLRRLADSGGDHVNRRVLAVSAMHQLFHNAQDAPVSIFVSIVPRRFPIARDSSRPKREQAGRRTPLFQAKVETTLKLVPCPPLRERPVRQQREAQVVIVELARAAGGWSPPVHQEGAESLIHGARPPSLCRRSGMRPNRPSAGACARQVASEYAPSTPPTL